MMRVRLLAISGALMDELEQHPRKDRWTLFATRTTTGTTSTTTTTNGGRIRSNRNNNPISNTSGAVVEDFSLELRANLPSNNTSPNVLILGRNTIPQIAHYRKISRRLAQISILPQNNNNNKAMLEPLMASKKSYGVVYLNGQLIQTSDDDAGGLSAFDLHDGDLLSIGIQESRPGRRICSFLVRIQKNNNNNNNNRQDTNNSGNGTLRRTTSTSTPTSTSSTPSPRNNLKKRKTTALPSSTATTSTKDPATAAGPSPAAAAGGSVAEELTCPLCLDILVQATTLVPCGHSFCASCVTQWMEQEQQQQQNKQQQSTTGGHSSNVSLFSCAYCQATVETRVVSHTINQAIARLVALGASGDSTIVSASDAEYYQTRLAQTQEGEDTTKPPAKKARHHHHQNHQNGVVTLPPARPSSSYSATSSSTMGRDSGSRNRSVVTVPLGEQQQLFTTTRSAVRSSPRFQPQAHPPAPQQHPSSSSLRREQQQHVALGNSDVIEILPDTSSSSGGTRRSLRQQRRSGSSLSSPIVID